MEINLSKIIGQKILSNLFTRLIKANKFPQTIMLEGLPGSGRRSLSIAISKALLCQSNTTGDSCGICKSCKLVDEGNHPDLTSLPHDTETSKVSVEMVRDDIVAKSTQSPLLSDKRIFLLPAIERLSVRQEASNALLKLLEEPGKSVHIIITKSSSGSTLSTITSRTQKFTLKPLSKPDIKEILLSQGMNQTEAKNGADLSSGSHRFVSKEGQKIPLPPIELMENLIINGYNIKIIAEIMETLPTKSISKIETDKEFTRRVAVIWLNQLAITMTKKLRHNPNPLILKKIEKIEELKSAINRNVAIRTVIESMAF